MRIRKLARIFPSNLNNYTYPQEQRVVSEVGSNEIEDEIDSIDSHQQGFHNPMVEANENQEMMERYQQVFHNLMVESIEDQEVMSDFSSSVRPNTSGPILKKGRGGGKLPRGWDGQEFKKLQVSVSEDGHLIGDDVIAYASACGVLARTTTRLPLSYKSWRAMPKAQKEDVWKEIQRNTTIPPEGHNMTLKMVGSYWRKFKSHLKRTYYEPHKNDVSPLCDDSRVVENQWKMLVDYWRMEETERRAEMNRQSRGHNNNVYHHRSGRIPHSVIMNKMANKGQFT